MTASRLGSPTDAGTPLGADGSLEFLRRRRSDRSIDPAAPVGDDVVARLLEAARWAPSSGNEQPWRYVVFDDHDPDARDEARACLTDGNAWARVAPVLLLSVTVTYRAKNHKPNAWAEHDTGAASVSAALQAAAEGLVFHQMGGFDAERARRSFGLPDDVRPMAMIAVGRPLPASSPEADEAARQRDEKPRTRMEVGEIARRGRLDGPGFP